MNTGQKLLNSQLIGMEIFVDNQPIKILLIEDDEDDYVVTHDLLNDINKNKYHLEWVTNYEDGIETIIKDQHDLVLLDHRLGPHSGLELLHNIREKGYHVPVILLTGYLDREVDIKAMKAGASDFLIKGLIDKYILEKSIRYAIEHSKMVEALRESEERYALTAQGANDGLWDWNLKTDIIYFSERWKSMLGFQGDEIGNSPEEWFKRIHPNDLGRLKTIFKEYQKRIDFHLSEECLMLHKDGTYRWMLIRGTFVSDATGNTYRIAGSLTDINHRKRAEEQLLYDAFHDNLTQLPNRALLTDRLERMLDRTKRHKNYKFAVLFIDIDRFKIVNDSLGHSSGDQLLVKISKRIHKCLRSCDTVARIGGDEFTILLDDIEGASYATQISDRVLKEVSSPFNIGQENIFITASIGIAFYSSDYKTPGNLLRDADTAMYQAKLKGKACYAVFDKTMHAQAMGIFQLEADLRRAIERKEFLAYYQPIISLENGEVVRMEALLRWLHPQKGLIPPMEFIPLAEETGMILPIGEWVIKTVCHDGSKWKKKGFPHIRMAINFSARQFQQRNLPDLLKKTIGETNITAPMIELELTESVAMRDVDFSIKILNTLRALNMQIAIDDFGIGYSSLNSLRVLPIDALKIDRCFIKDLPNTPSSTAITKTIINLAHNLNMRVVAEGVETQAQLDFLREHKCDEAQGFLFSHPVPFQDATSLLTKNYLQ